jgi:hypothetical protein
MASPATQQGTIRLKATLQAQDLASERDGSDESASEIFCRQLERDLLNMGT